MGTHLYLDRYWSEEREVARDLLTRSARKDPLVELGLLTEGLQRLFGSDGDELQRVAAACAVLRWLTVVGGGPGTGKTTTVARIVALLAEQAQARGAPLPVVALATPTAKAAARLEEAVREQASDLAVDAQIRDQLLDLRALTLHRLLSARGAGGGFWHNHENRLPHDVIIVDETSMVPLSMMASLLEAISEEARVILIGDPGQLYSIEAGAVLGDIIGDAADGLRMRASTRTVLTKAVGVEVPASEPPAGVTIGDGIVLLRHIHRFGKDIAEVAEAVRRGDADATLEKLRAGADAVMWISCDPAEPEGERDLRPLIDGVVRAAREVVGAARVDAAADALAALGSFRVLCAHRRGPHGVANWTSRIEGWLADQLKGFNAGEETYAGRPLLVNENDYELRLYNGDTGVIVQDSPDHLTAVFDRAGTLLRFSPTRLAVQTVYAMTIHKSQGSQFRTAGRSSTSADIPDPDARASIHRGHAGAGASDCRRHRGDGSRSG